MIPEFENIDQRIAWLVKNNSMLIAQKKAAVKYADAIVYAPSFVIGDKEESVIKADAGAAIIDETAKQIKVRSIINTTKLMDSHGDVHIDQLWNKSLKDNKNFYLVKEHNFGFDGIISDNVKAFVKQMSWHELGINYEGKTQALIFDSLIDKEDTTRPEMFEAYRKGKVKQHSVGMRYVKIDLAVNDERYEKEFALWEKYFPEIANKEDALDAGYFYPVTEAKIIEGSAVVIGSNWATPVLNIQQAKGQPSQDTDKEQEPPKRTLKASELMKFYQPII